MVFGLALSTSGCANRTTDGNGITSVLRNAAYAILAGQSYDRATIAAQRENTESLAVSADDLRRSGATELAHRAVARAAEDAVDAALLFDTLAEQSSDGATEKWRARAATEYRKALRLMPDFDSSDANKLNALGYFLADRGSSSDDYKQAERLTRDSLKLWDKQLAQFDKNDPDLPRLRFAREVGPHDSLAWALYRQRRFKEALQEQTAAIAGALAAAATSKTSTGPISSDLYFHLGEMYRALDRPQEARRQYQEALRLDPNNTASRRALQKLPQR